MKIFAYKNCDSCRKALKWIKENEIEAEVIAIREQPPSVDELKIMLAAYGGEVKKLFNTSGRDYREMQIKDKMKTLSTEELLRLLSENGNLVKRPFALSAEQGRVGFKVEEWFATFGK